MHFNNIAKQALPEVASELIQTFRLILTDFKLSGASLLSTDRRKQIQTNKQTNLDFPDAAGRAPEKQFCFSPEGADSPYETYFPIACTTVPCLQPIGLAMVD